MNHHDEHLLYLTDRWAWAQYVAPKWARTLEKADEAEKRMLWRIAGPELKAAIRALKSESELTSGEPGNIYKMSAKDSEHPSCPPHKTWVIR